MLCLLVLLSVAVCFGAESDGGKAYRIPLSDGNTMPGIGFGTFVAYIESKGIYKLHRPVAEHEVEYPVGWALEAGFRMIDSAASYHTEDQVGVAIRNSGIPREDVFIVTKLATNAQRDVVGALRQSLQELNISYVDLYLIHEPIAYKPDFSDFDVIDYLDTWKGMEEVKRLGLAKSIGLSNFNISQIERLLENCEIRPVALEVEVNVNLSQEELLAYCKEQDIVVMGYSPLASIFNKNPAFPPPKADDPVLVEMANKYGKTIAQIAIRYVIQKGVVPITKSFRKERVAENIDVFDFQLDDEDMATLAEFNCDFRIVSLTFSQDHPYFPYERDDTL